MGRYGPETAWVAQSHAPGAPRRSQGHTGASRLVVLILGPPGSGKSTLAAEMAQEWGMTLFDRDQPQWADDDRAFLRAVRHECHRADARAVVVRTGATPLGRARIIDTTAATRILVMNTSPEECLRRIQARGRGDLQFQAQGIVQWFASPPTPQERSAWEARPWVNM